jgi:endonuclease/exonuclease/phosphatase family metal-dependent hydrolase
VHWPIVALDRIWVNPPHALRRVVTHATPTARLASDHFPVVADIDPGTSESGERHQPPTRAVRLN